MIGDYGHIIDDSPYVLEEVFNRWDKLVRSSTLIYFSFCSLIYGLERKGESPASYWNRQALLQGPIP